MANDEKVNEKLFTEFPPVPTREWEAQLMKDLKGADYRKKLIWQTHEGFEVKPYYRSEDLEGLPQPNTFPGQFPYIRGNHPAGNDWFIRQDIYVDNPEEANAKALDVLMRGANSLRFLFNGQYRVGEPEIDRLLEKIHAEAVELCFGPVADPLKVVQAMISLAGKYNRDFEKIRGTLDVDPLGELTSSGTLDMPPETAFDKIAELVNESAVLPRFRLVLVDGSLFTDAGSSLSASLAFSLAKGVNYLTQLTERGISIDRAAPALHFRFGLGSNYFMEIARIRAARWLWARIVKSYGPSSDEYCRLYLHATSGLRNKTVYDPWVNMLRTTTESMSAVIAGLDALTVMPYDAAFRCPDEFSERIARNQQLLLKEESGFNRVADPAAGSYYIENLTARLAESAWELFLKVQEFGSYYHALEAGFIQEVTEASARQQDKEYAVRKATLLGVNQYPDLNEEHPGLDDQLFDTGSIEPGKEGIRPLKPFRAAIPFERLRFATDLFAKDHGRPVVFLATMGPLAWRRARAQFAINFFGAAGYQIIDNNGFEDAAKAAEAARNAKASVVVLCSSDEEYPQMARNLIPLLDRQMIPVVAGNPGEEMKAELDQAGIMAYIHARSNLLESIAWFHKKLGIPVDVEQPQND